MHILLLPRGQLLEGQNPFLLHVERYDFCVNNTVVDPIHQVIPHHRDQIRVLLCEVLRIAAVHINLAIFAAHDVDLSPLPVVFVLRSACLVPKLLHDLCDSSSRLRQHGLHRRSHTNVALLRQVGLVVTLEQGAHNAVVAGLLTESPSHGRFHRSHSHVEVGLTGDAIPGITCQCFAVFARRQRNSMSHGHQHGSMIDPDPHFLVDHAHDELDLRALGSHQHLLHDFLLCLARLVPAELRYLVHIREHPGDGQGRGRKHHGLRPAAFHRRLPEVSDLAIFQVLSQGLLRS
mmetsp:Transcript_41582/g.90636  ORF Transcript_41582/g.90636 Transcript_41582/m.90636 type:complete len:290 (-) Transcript_41582:569-1438(-)